MGHSLDLVKLQKHCLVRVVHTVAVEETGSQVVGHSRFAEEGQQGSRTHLVVAVHSQVLVVAHMEE